MAQTEQFHHNSTQTEQVTHIITPAEKAAHTITPAEQADHTTTPAEQADHNLKHNTINNNTLTGKINHNHQQTSTTTEKVEHTKHITTDTPNTSTIATNPITHNTPEVTDDDIRNRFIKLSNVMQRPLSTEEIAWLKNTVPNLTEQQII